MIMITMMMKMTYSVVRMENVGGGRIVDDDDAAQVPAEAVQVFHVVAAVEHAAIAEQPRAEHAPSGTPVHSCNEFLF